MNIDIYNTDRKYKTIYMDPPWAEQGGGKIKRGADRHYPLMKTKDAWHYDLDAIFECQYLQ